MKSLLSIVFWFAAMLMLNPQATNAQTTTQAVQAAKGAGASSAQIQQIQGMSNAQIQQAIKQLPPAAQQQANQAMNQQNMGDGVKKNNLTESGEQSSEPESQDNPEVDLELDLEDGDVSVKKNFGRFGRGNRVFGHELFSSRNLTFAPSVNMPTPPNYILSAGDQLYIDIWGTAQEHYDVKISPDGYINLPNVGLIPLSGLTITQAEQRIKSRLSEVVSGLNEGNVNIKISLGDMRSIKVNIIGEAAVPGTYTLPSLSTLFNALYVAGGVSSIGSLRDIKLYRAGKEIAKLDVYDYLIHGKQEVNVRLEDNDMIVVAPYDNIVTITGKVKRPKSYEMKKGETMQDLVTYAGGYRGDSYYDELTLRRKAGGNMLSIYTIPNDELTAFNVSDGDLLEVGEVLNLYANKVAIAGSVWRPGDYELSDSVKTVLQLIGKAKGVLSDAFLGRASIIRSTADGRSEIITMNLGDMLADNSKDIELMSNDRVIVPSLNDIREGRVVSIKGAVNNPMTIGYLDNITIEDMIVAAGGLNESAALSRIEVSRRIKNPYSTSVSDKNAELFSFTIPADLSLTPESAKFKLEPFDEIFIRRSPGYKTQESVFISGEILFGGEYTMSRASERLTDLVNRAGGLTPEAYVKGTQLQRQFTVNDLSRIKSLNKIINSNNSVGDTVLVDQVKVGMYYPVGIDLAAALENPEGSDNITLQPGDRVIVPTFNNTVRINGSVYYPNTVTYQPKENLKNYIDKAGGYRKRSIKRPFVIYMNGMVAATKGGVYPKIEPGCEIVVPQKAPRSGNALSSIMGMTTSITSIAALVSSMLR